MTNIAEIQQPPHLKVVAKEGDSFLARMEPASTLPDFEGNKVSGSAIKLSACDLKLDNYVFGSDDILKLVIEVRVRNVSHNVDEKTGKLIRQHVAKAEHAAVVKWDVEVENLRSE